MIHTFPKWVNKRTIRKTVLVIIGSYFIVIFTMLKKLNGSLEINIFAAGQLGNKRSWHINDYIINISNGYAKYGSSIIWPNENHKSDRILEQLVFAYIFNNNLTIPDEKVQKMRRDGQASGDRPDRLTHKLIAGGQYANSESFGTEPFQGCHISSCYLYRNLEVMPDMTQADAYINFPPGNRQPNQILIYHNLESPMNSPVENVTTLFNWTATYRLDSTIVAPYARLVQLEDVLYSGTSQQKNYAAGKSKMAAWFVTNCNDHNGRLVYAKQLQKYIEVDIYGACGPLTCSRLDEGEKCLEMLRKDYKFYLAFENSNCRDYITEKFFHNALSNDVLPVVMGAHPDQYRHVAPTHSYIHVEDFQSPRHLADHLIKLDSDDALYSEYFRWKGTGTFIDTRFWCRFCAMLHLQDELNYVHWYPDINQWWNETSAPCVHVNQSLGYATWRGLNE